MINQICACIGPAFNEPLCSCKMVNQGLERSHEYKEFMLPENVERRREETKKAMADVFGVK
jgi:hypothetical protein